MKNISILGDGLLGSELQNQRPNWSLYSRRLANFDIKDINVPESDVIINCIAHTNTYDTNRQLNWDVNYKFVSDLVEYCNTTNTKLIHISTDYVYSNSDANASEDSVPVHCNNWYGYTKLLADGYVQLKSNDHLIVRCTHKPTPFPYESAWIDQIGNFDYVDVIASLIINLIEKNCSGIYNVGTHAKTMHELAKRTKTVNSSFRPKYVPGNTSMNINKLTGVICDLH
jgi:dTDP-4-dehydrorhamnose reductase